MDDAAAIALYVKDGWRREVWCAVDEAVRLYYRLRIRPVSAMRMTVADPPPGAFSGDLDQGW